MAPYVLGMNAGLYQGATGTTEPASMTEVDNVRDVTAKLAVFVEWYEVMGS